VTPGPWLRLLSLASTAGVAAVVAVLVVAILGGAWFGVPLSRRSREGA